MSIDIVLCYYFVQICMVSEIENHENKPQNGSKFIERSLISLEQSHLSAPSLHFLKCLHRPIGKSCNFSILVMQNSSRFRLHTGENNLNAWPMIFNMNAL